MIAEALLQLENSGLVNGGTGGTVLIVLHDKRIHKASEGIGVAGLAFDATQRIGPSGCRVPVTVGDGLSVGKRNGAKWRWEKIGVNGHGEADRMRVNVTRGDRDSWSDFPLNSELGLLRIRIPKVRLVDENHLKLGKWTAIGHVETKLSQPSRARARGNTSVASRCRLRAADGPLGE